MTTYNYGILSMQKTYNSRLECPQGRDLKTVGHIPYILHTAADDGSANHAIMFLIQCQVEICDRCTIHLAASSVSSASPTLPQVSRYDYLWSITHPMNAPSEQRWRVIKWHLCTTFANVFCSSNFPYCSKDGGHHQGWHHLFRSCSQINFTVRPWRVLKFSRLY